MMVVIRIGTKDLLQKYEETKNMNKEEEIENNRIIELVEIGNDSNADDDIETGNVILSGHFYIILGQRLMFFCPKK